jgi:eukaryotic-like serine/threonine-protein kinase
MAGSAASRLARFSPFEFDLRARELRREGLKVTVQDQPLRVLAMLVERPGELVTRDELHRRLWPSDTFVDFEHGLNAAIKRLRSALSDSADSPQFVETLPRRGYRFIAPMERREPESGQDKEMKLTRLVALPFRILRIDPETDFLAFSVPDAIAAALVGIRSLVVRSPITAARYAADVPDFDCIARELEVDAVVTGTIVRIDERIRIATQLVRAPGGHTLWSHVAEITLGNLFHHQDEVVHRIVESLSVSLSARDKLLLESDVPSNAHAFELYLRANRILVQGVRGGEQLTVAREWYQKALEQDPGYAPAWARLGRCHWLIAKGAEDAANHLDESDACFKRALEINPYLPLAHSLHGQLEADLGRAPQAMVRLLGLAQAGPTTPELYAALVHLCRFCGQLEASIAADERARGLDPHISTSANHTYWQLGDLNKAFSARASGTFSLDAMILERWGRAAEAIKLLREREAHLPETSRIYIASQRALFEGNRDECLRLTESAIARWPDPEGRYYLATNLARIGCADRAIAELNEALDRGFIHYRLLSHDTAVDSLRSMPSFNALLDRATARYADACVAFTDAGGQCLFGL